MATTASEKPSTKTSTKKPSTAKSKVAAATTTDAKAPAKATTSKPRATKKALKPALSPEQRYLMVQEAAYYIAEKDGFSGNPAEYWAQAEAQISQM